MNEPGIPTFFYGSYMNPEVLRGLGYAPQDMETALVRGFDIRIGPLANLVRSDDDVVYGVVASLTQRELETLYAHARDVLGGIYVPEAVVTETLKGEVKAARCYIAPVLEEKPATNDYIDRIVTPARDYEFPAWYIDKLESFRP